MAEPRKGDRALFTIEFTSSSYEYTDEDDDNNLPEQGQLSEIPRPELSQPVKVTTRTFQAPLETHVEPDHEKQKSGQQPVNETLPEEVNEDIFTLQESPTASPLRSSPQPASQRRLIAIPKKVVKTSQTYVVMREKSGFGKSASFIIREGKNEFFRAKLKKSMINIWMTGKDVKASPDYVMIVGNDGRDFSLRKAISDPEEIILIRYQEARLPVDNARKMNVFFSIVKEGSPTRLVSRNPKLNPDGRPQHDFGGKFAINSIKNALLVAATDGPPLMAIRKAGKHVLELDVLFPHEPLWIFAVGLSSFISKTH